MSINYIGADVDCKMTEVAIEKNGKIVARDRVPTNIKSLRKWWLRKVQWLVGYIEILNPMSIAL